MEKAATLTEMLKPEPQSEVELRERELSGSLQRLEPGIYIDGCSNRYFYLTGLYSVLRDKRVPYLLFEHPQFVVEVLEGIRNGLKIECLELTD